MLEKKIQSEVVEYGESLGCLAFKLEAKNKRGFPDYTFLIPWGHTFYIEFKTPTGVLSGPQKRRIKELRAAGRTVYVIDNIKAGKNAIDKEFKKLSNTV